VTDTKADAQVVTLAIPPRPEYVAVVRVVVTAAAAAGSALESDRIDDLRIAVSEACTNAVEAHAAAELAQPIEVLCAVDADGVCVTVRDRGAGFDPATITPPPPMDAPQRLLIERGLGIPLLRALADHVEFTSGDDGTEVRLVVLPGHHEEDGRDGHDPQA
jgi:serine/threonine-protein kinase RsbW